MRFGFMVCPGAGSEWRSVFEVVDVHHPTVAGRLAEEDPIEVAASVLRAKQIGYVVLSPALVRAQPE